MGFHISIFLAAVPTGAATATACIAEAKAITTAAAKQQDYRQDSATSAEPTASTAVVFTAEAQVAKAITTAAAQQ